MESENIAFPGGYQYFAEHFGHKKYNYIWKMPSVLLTETLAMDLEGQEQWPEDAKLYQPVHSTQILLPEYANCLAVQAYLKMSGLKFEVVEKHNAEFMSPSGKVPFVKCGAYLISDLEPIINFVKNKGINISERLTMTERSDMRAYMSLANNIFLNSELYMCWCDNETYENVTWRRYGSVFSWPLNYLVTWQKKWAMRYKLNLFDWGKKDMAQVLCDVRNCCVSLSERLEKNEYFFGNKPTELDALVFGHIFSIRTTSLPGNKLSSIIQEFPNLLELCKRIDKRYFQV